MLSNVLLTGVRVGVQANAEKWLDQASFSAVIALQNACMHYAACCLAVPFLHQCTNYAVGSSSTYVHVTFREKAIHTLSASVPAQVFDSIL